VNALFLKDLAEKTHRGLRGRFEDGKSAGGLCYGYRVVKTLSGGTVTTGEREIEPAEATVVERIFREFIAGVSPKQIAKNLNRQSMPGPFGGAWSLSDPLHCGSSRWGSSGSSASSRENLSGAFTSAFLVSSRSRANRSIQGCKHLSGNVARKRGGLAFGVLLPLVGTA
jgi:hypothetical protein